MNVVQGRIYLLQYCERCKYKEQEESGNDVCVNTKVHEIFKTKKNKEYFISNIELLCNPSLFEEKK